MPIGLAIIVIALTFYTMSEIVEGPFIKSLDNIAQRMKLPPSVAGATLLAFGTSAPEISTALVALFAEGASPATGIGSIVGSAIFQILVVIGFASTVRTSTLDWRPILRDSIFYALSIVLLIVFTRDDRLTLLEGAILVGSYFLYLFAMWLWARNIEEPPSPPQEPEASKPPTAPSSLLRRVSRIFTWPIDLIIGVIPDPDEKKNWTVAVFLISLSIIGYACYWMVFAAESLANALSVPPAIIALTILAGGSSVPELVSSAKIAREGRGDMAIANAIGSNVFDILISLGLPVLLYCSMKGDLVGLGGANVTSSVLLLFATLIMVVVLLAAQHFKAGKKFGVFLILIYAFYVVSAYLGWIS